MCMFKYVTAFSVLVLKSWLGESYRLYVVSNIVFTDERIVQLRPNSKYRLLQLLSVKRKVGIFSWILDEVFGTFLKIVKH